MNNCQKSQTELLYILQAIRQNSKKVCSNIKVVMKFSILINIHKGPSVHLYNLKLNCMHVFYKKYILKIFIPFLFCNRRT